MTNFKPKSLALRLIKAYLLFNNNATSNELCLFLEKFNLGKSFITRDIAPLIKYGNAGRTTQQWFNVEHIEGTHPTRWRIKK